MFDPYRKWLGISPEHRPPTHYQLLGIAASEDDPEVIEEAALRQIAHVRAYQIGAHAQLCTRILNELAQAKTVLLSPAKKREYDAALAQKQAALSAKAAAVAAEPAAVTTAPPTVTQSARSSEKKEKRSKKRKSKRGVVLSVPMLAGIGGGVALVLVVVLFVAFRGSSPPVAPPVDPVAQIKPKVDPAPPPVNPPVQPPVQPPVKPPEVEVKPKEPPVVPDVKEVLPPAKDKMVGDVLVFDAPERKLPLILTASADGRKVVRAGLQSPEMIDLTTGQLSTLPVPSGNLFRFSPDATHFASVSHVDLYYCSLDGKVSQTVRNKGMITDVVFSADNKIVAAIARGRSRVVDDLPVIDKTTGFPVWDDAAIRLWDVATGKELGTATGHTAEIQTIAFAPDGTLLSCGMDGLRRWDSTGRALGHTPTNHLIARFSPDGKALFGTVMSIPATLAVYNIADAKAVGRIPFRMHPMHTAVSNESNYVLCSFKSSKGNGVFADETVLWDMVAGAPVRQAEVYSQHVALSRDGKIATFGDKDGRIWQWNLDKPANGNVVKIVPKVDPNAKPINPKVINPFLVPKSIDYLDASNVKPIDLAGKELTMMPATRIINESTINAELVHRPLFRSITPMGTSANGRLALYLQDRILIVNLETRTGYCVPVPVSISRLGVALSDDAQVVAASSSEGVVFSTHLGKKLSSIAGAYRTMALSRDGKLCATAGSAKAVVQLWDTASGNLVWTGDVVDNLPISSLAFCEDGSVVSTGGSGLRRWDGKTGRAIGHFAPKLAHSRVTADGKFLYGGETMQGPFVLYDVAAQKLVRKVPMEGQFFGPMMLSTDGRYFVVSGRSLKGDIPESTSCWDTETGKELHRHNQASFSVAMAANGSSVFVCDPDGRIWRWAAAPPVVEPK